MITASDRYSGNDRYSGIKSPDRFFHYSGRCLYFLLKDHWISRWSYCFFAKELKKDAIAVILETRSGPALALKGVTPPPSVPEGPMSDVGNSAPWPRHQSQCLLVNYSSCVQASEKLKAKKYISKYSSTHLISQFATKNVPASF